LQAILFHAILASMPERSKKPREDVNEIAHRILREATGDDEPEMDEEARKLAARILGRRGGLKGGPARAKKLSKKRRSEIAKKAAEARWKNRKQ
jgi:hypothetical protein